MAQHNTELTHVALIPDGIRRWARDNKVPLSDAYKAVCRVLVNAGDILYGHGVRSLSIYVLSKNNLQRSKDDLAVTFASHIHIFQEVMPELVKRWNAHVFHTGDSACLPSDYVLALHDVCTASLQTQGKTEIYLCAGYSTEWEAHDGHTSEFTRSVPYDIDMLLRTGGELRLSGFLPLQLQYAEFFFLKKLFPDIQRADIERAIDEYYIRDRRFGR